MLSPWIDYTFDHNGHHPLVSSWFFKRWAVVYMPSQYSHPHLHFSTNMTIVSNDPAWWPAVNAFRFSSYFSVASFIVVSYDWALTFGQEVELVWRQRWSLMTVLYLGVRYLGIFYAALNMLYSVTTISLTDTVSFIICTAYDSIGVVIFVMLGVIIITRLHAMYQRSRKILIFLVVPFLGLSIFCGVAIIMSTINISGGELVLSGTYQCSFNYAGDVVFLDSLNWILATVWEVFALCLAVWIAVKHFRELRRYSAGGLLGDCFTVLMKTHVLYFASFVAVACFRLVTYFSSADQYSIYFQIFVDGLSILAVVQMFVLGPRLILSIREYHARLVVDSDAATGMISIAFQERVHISTGSSV
ncbi:hypothetical protein BDR07DRAFT_238323 [Suillus spraguei]|nr:hypothetical protein BDR07DRAFT_238323 [Suillus spraguei]